MFEFSIKLLVRVRIFDGLVGLASGFGRPPDHHDHTSRRLFDRCMVNRTTTAHAVSPPLFMFSSGHFAHFGSACMMSRIPYQTNHRGTDSSNHGVCMLEVLHTFTRKDRGKTSSTRLTCMYSCRLSLGYFDNKCRGFFSPHTSLASA